MMDLWELLVQGIFQSFWAAVIGLCVIMFIIMIIGKLSMITITNFLSIFLFSMAIGYGYSLISIIIFIGIFIMYIIEIPRQINSAELG